MDRPYKKLLGRFDKNVTLTVKSALFFSRLTATTEKALNRQTMKVAGS